MKVLVTGATGSLGGGVARRLEARGHEVVGTGRDSAAGAELERDGVRFVRADLRDAEAQRRVATGVEVVVHAAARSSPWGRRADFEADNVEGTRHVLAACAANGVRRLVHVSTPSVYHDGRDRLGLDECSPFAARPANEYVRSKLAAEQLVQAAEPELEIVVLRPRAIFGPGDRVVLPRLVRALEAGRLPRIGSEGTRMDLTYVDNAADALVAAVEAGERVVGRAFNVTDGTPVLLWPTVDALADRLGLARPTRRVPARVARAYAGALEFLHRTVRRESEPLFTRTSVELLSTSVTFDVTAAREVLGHRPAVSTDEGLDRFVAWWREHA